MNLKYWKIVLGILAISILLNVFACIPCVADWYVMYVQSGLVNTYAYFMGLFSFSVGELIYACGCLLAVMVLLSLIFVVFLRKKIGFRKYFKRLLKTVLAVVVVDFFICTLSHNIATRCQPLKINEGNRAEEYNVAELEAVRNYIVKKCNTLSTQIERDESGYAVYAGDIQKQSIIAMQGISDIIPRLAGYYPRMKPVLGSRFMSVTGIAGVYFAETMEVNYNSEMYVTNYPPTFCHEYAHVKGFMREDEANFIGFLACIESEDIFFQYCGYLSVYDYIDAAYIEHVSEERYGEQIQANDMVIRDDIFIDSQVWDAIYDGTDEWGVDIGQLNDMQDTITDIEIKLSGDEDGIESYDRVTELLLQYFDIA